MKAKFRSYGMLGKHHSQETKDKISAAKKGRKYHIMKRKEVQEETQQEQMEESESEEERRYSLADDQTLRQIILMSKVIFNDSTPLTEQPDILRKIKILNYALAEWNDEFERRYGKPKNPKSEEEIIKEIFSKYVDSEGRLIT
jgi:NUMOD3 motif